MYGWVVEDVFHHCAAMPSSVGHVVVVVGIGKGPAFSHLVIPISCSSAWFIVACQCQIPHTGDEYGNHESSRFHCLSTPSQELAVNVYDTVSCPPHRSAHLQFCPHTWD